MNGQVDLAVYNRHVCPWCRSGNYREVTVLPGWHSGTSKHREIHDYYYCLNCKRITTGYNRQPDRKAMRRDYNKLGKALARKNK